MMGGCGMCSSRPGRSQVVRALGIYLSQNPILNTEQADKPSLMSTELVNNNERSY